jgi:glycosyltransferase involved in cell wall biosynthesis
VLFQCKLALALSRRRASSRECLFFLSSSSVSPAAAVALAGLDPRRLIYHTQDFLEPGRHRFWSFFERVVARHAARVLCNEPSRARCLASLYGLARAPDVVPTYLPADWPRAPFDAQLRRDLLDRAGCTDFENARLIMHAGPLSDVRCASQLLHAIELLPRCYILVTTGESTPHRSALAPLQEQGRFLALPHLAHPELLRHCACCDSGLLLYPNDGIGNFFQAPGRLTEYLGAGLSIVASNFPGLASLVSEYDLGRVCDPDAPRDIARAIREVGDVPAARHAAERERLRTLARTRFAYEKAEPILHAAVRDALSSAAQPATIASLTSLLRE